MSKVDVLSCVSEETVTAGLAADSDLKAEPPVMTAVVTESEPLTDTLELSTRRLGMVTP